MFRCWWQQKKYMRAFGVIGQVLGNSETVNTDAAVNFGRWMVTKVQHAAVYGNQRTWSVTLKAELWIPPTEYHTHILSTDVASSAERLQMEVWESLLLIQGYDAAVQNLYNPPHRR